MSRINIDGNNVRITNPEKYLWPELKIRKIDYITKLVELADYIIPYTSNRLLTTIRYPDGIDGKSFYQKRIPKYAPEWIDRIQWKGNNYINLNKLSTLAWLGNQAALEIHTSFDYYKKEDYPTSLVFDLDPSKGQSFDDVVEVALIVHETLEELEIKSWVKTSGATGLQIYIPTGNKYTYETGRKINEFFGKYFSERYPRIITIERIIEKRGAKLYFDYLQMWRGKSITAPYSPRATRLATVSAPVTWEELKKGIKPQDFSLLNIKERLDKTGDLFKDILLVENFQNLDHILNYIKKGSKV